MFLFKRNPIHCLEIFVFFQGKISTPTDEQKPFPTSARKTPTLRYNTKKANTDQQQRAKTVDVVRLKTG